MASRGSGRYLMSPARVRDIPIRSFPKSGHVILHKKGDEMTAPDPTASFFDEGQRFPLCQPEPLQRLFQAARLRQGEVCPIDVPTTFQDFDDYWTPFLGGQGPAPGYAMSLSTERRLALREYIRATLPIAPDGTIHLTACAWAIRGRVQEQETDPGAHHTE